MSRPQHVRTALSSLSALLLAAAQLAASTPDLTRAGNLDARLNARDLQARAVAARGERARRLAIGAAGRAEAVAAAVAGLATRVPGIEVELSRLTGGPVLVANRRGPLTAAAVGKGSVDIVRAYLAENRAVYGLDEADLASLAVVGDSPGGRSGLRLVRLEQQVDGLPVFASESRFLLDRDGRLWRTLGTLVPGAVADAPTVDRRGLRSPVAALVDLLAAGGLTVAAADVASRAFDGGSTAGGPASGNRVELAAPLPVAGPASARLVLFPLAPGLLVPAWSLTVFTSGDEDWYAVVDAETGDLLWRKNIRESASTQQARFSVYVQADGKTPADSPAPKSPTTALPGGGTQFPEIARTSVDMLTVQSLAASPDGWVPDGGTTTTGNNVDACVDRVGGAGETNVCDLGTLDSNGRPVGNPDVNTRNRDFLGAAPRNYTYAPAPVGGDANAGDTPTGAGAVQTQFRRGAVTQLFYVANWYHDRLFALGFDEGAGNFQLVNTSGQGVGGDRVLADAQDSGGFNNANFSTPADGTSGRMQMYLWNGPTPDRDGDLDTSLVVHELSHGLSHRLIGNATGLLWDPARGMGEGWSDFYALALLNATNADDPNARYAFGPYAMYGLPLLPSGNLADNYAYGVRRFPYTTDNAVNPLTWADVDAVTYDLGGGIAVNPADAANGALEVHNAGEVWALSLWEVRARVIADPAGANGDVPSGNETMLQLVTDGLKLTPANPSFIDGRDALLAADQATHASANEVAIWSGFADRGLGYRAVAPISVGGRFARSHMGIGESFVTPYLDVLGAGAIVVSDGPDGNGDGRLDPGETATLTVSLTNPWRRAAANATGISATLSTVTPGVTILDATASYPAIAPQGTGSNAADTFRVALAGSLSCGQRLQFTLQTVSSLGTRNATFDVRVGTPGGAGPVTTFSSAPNLALVGSRPDGVAATMSVAADLEIADLDFRVSSLTHPVTGQLKIMLRAPNGYGTDLIWHRGALASPNQAIAANFTNTVIDDDLAFVASEDLNQSLATEAPFTGDWLPAFNSPFWDSYVTTPAVASDPIGELGRLDGTSTQGVWTVNVADNTPSSAQTGTLDTWAILVQPRSFTCTTYVPPAPLLSDGFESGSTGLWSSTTPP